MIEKRTECVRFMYQNQSEIAEIKVDSKIEFIFQVPNNEDRPERAILVKFTSNDEGHKFKFDIFCRVIFRDDSEEQFKDLDAFFDAHQEEAYEAMKEMANNAMAAIGKPRFDFPDICD